MHKFFRQWLMQACLVIMPWVLLANPTVYDLDCISDQAIKQRALPGFCLQVGNAKRVLFDRCFGHFRYDQGSADSVRSQFDLASLTKVIATTTVVMKLHQQQRIDLDASVAHYLSGYKQDITIRQLLDHSSGLPAEIKPPYTWRRVLQAKPTHTPGTHYRYSDVNFLLLQRVIEHILKQPFAAIVQDWVLQPLSMHHSGFNKTGSTVVPTMARTGVNDPLAYALGGVAGNAGLYATIDDVGRYARMLLSGGQAGRWQYLLPSTIDLFSRRDLRVPHSTRALGFDSNYDPSDTVAEPHQFSAGQWLDANAFGHTGYTGTSLWVSRRDGTYIVLLSNARLRNDLQTQHKQRYFRQRIADVAEQIFASHPRRNATVSEKMP